MEPDFSTGAAISATIMFACGLFGFAHGLWKRRAGELEPGKFTDSVLLSGVAVNLGCILLVESFADDRGLFYMLVQAQWLTIGLLLGRRWGRSGYREVGASESEAPSGLS